MQKHNASLERKAAKETSPLLGASVRATSTPFTSSSSQPLHDQHNRTESESTILPESARTSSSSSILPFVKVPSPWIVLPAGVLHLFCYALCLLPLQGFLLQKACWELGVHGSVEPFATKDEDAEACRASEEASKLAGRWLTIYLLCAALPAILATPVLGMLLDSIGRRPIMLLSAAVLLVNILSIVGAGLGLPFWVIFLGNFVCGSFGGYHILVVALHSYISDTVTEANRAQFFSFSDAILSAAAFAAPYVGGVLVTFLGPLGSFYTAFAIELVVLLYISLIIPESLAVENRKTIAASPEAIASQSVAPAWKDVLYFAWVSAVSSFSTLRGRSKTLVAVYLFVGDCIVAGLGNYIILFFTLRFNWTPIELGQYLLVVSVYRMFYLAIVLPTMIYLFIRYRAAIGSGVDPGISKERFGFDLGMLKFAWSLMAVGYVAIGTVTEGWLMYIISFGYGFAYIGVPTARSILSRCVSSDQQGRLFAALNIATSVAGSIGPSLFGVIYFLDPQAMFFSMAGCVLVGVILITFVKKEELAAAAVEAGSGSEEVFFATNDE
ncbi:hypothetical protein HDU97_004538 [Phlyctochytrium planicorne]|nr:hypothetical protein HDU97_004538 [Phlyctochytrium planicorne]